MNASVLQLDSVSHHYGPLEVLRDVSLTVRQGEFVAIVGPSGCGKTTLLSLVSGVERPTRGRISHQGTLRTVYQQEGLLPWLTVRENIFHGLSHLPTQSERLARIEQWLAHTRLDGFGDHYPHQLSGGMRQRAQLARVLAGNADLLLLDEPFSALDYQTRLSMRHELCNALAVRPSTVVFVTHDLEEAVTLADRVLVLSERPARILSTHTPSLARPRSTSHPEVGQLIEHIIGELKLGGPAPAGPRVPFSQELTS
ncbi:ABC transporter ATP-binding protein [Hyalangium minutum]|uniref:ABC transporter ATP-binding protein n=1 Tax=Hyalangium minutum TaxID=394096 RepID=UPI0005C69B51|nr:ABC transporter ATP-binding protein [Hyalangium minutum]